MTRNCRAGNEEMYHGMEILSMRWRLFGCIFALLSEYEIRLGMCRGGFVGTQQYDYFASGALAGVVMMWSTSPYAFAASASMK